MTPFTFTTDSAIEKQIRQRVRLAVKAFKKANPDPEGAFRKILTVRPVTIRWSGFLRLKILHRQFSEGTVLGLPVIVRGARFLYSRYRTLKRAIPDNS